MECTIKFSINDQEVKPIVQPGQLFHVKLESYKQIEIIHYSLIDPSHNLRSMGKIRVQSKEVNLPLVLHSKRHLGTWKIKFSIISNDILEKLELDVKLVEKAPAILRTEENTLDKSNKLKKDAIEDTKNTLFDNNLDALNNSNINPNLSLDKQEEKIQEVPDTEERVEEVVDTEERVEEVVDTEERIQEVPDTEERAEEVPDTEGRVEEGSETRFQGAKSGLILDSYTQNTDDFDEQDIQDERSFKEEKGLSEELSDHSRIVDDNHNLDSELTKENIESSVVTTTDSTKGHKIQENEEGITDNESSDTTIAEGSIEGYPFSSPKYSNIKEEYDLREIYAIELEEELEKDLEIPIQELDLVESVESAILAGSGKKYVSDLLQSEAYDISLLLPHTSPQKIAYWYDQCNQMMENYDHDVRKVYRQMRELEERQREQLLTLLDTPQADDYLDELQIENDMVKALNEAGYELVKDLVKANFAEIVSKGFERNDVKKWMRSAKLYVGLDRISKSMWE